jgi:hypothetical protein
MRHNRYEVRKPVHHVEIDRYLKGVLVDLNMKNEYFIPRNSSSLETFNKLKSLSKKNRRATNIAVHAITTAAVHNEFNRP